MSSILPSSLTSGTSSASSPAGSGTALTSTGGQGTVSSVGLGSGLDINSIVSQLVAAEGSGPTKLLDGKTSKINSQLSAYGQFQAAVSALQASLATLASPTQFQTNAATVADSNVASATADSTAAGGSYSLQVVRLAQGAQLISGPVAGAGAPVGTGTLTIKIGTTSVPVTIDAGNNNLAGIAAAINSAGATQGLSASLLTANDGVHLVLTSAATGAVNAVSVSQAGGDGGLASLVYDPASQTNPLTQQQAAQDAQVKLNGYTLDSPSNVVTNLLTGVTLNLKAPSAGNTTTTLSVAVDHTAAQTAVQSFVSSYNTLANAVSQLSSYNASTGSAGPLLGDGLLNSFISQVNNALNSSVASLKGGPFSTLAEIGIVANVDGTLSADPAKLNAAVNNNYASVAQLFSGTGGVATKLNDLLTQYTQPTTGILAQQTRSLQRNLKDIATQKTALNQRLANLQAQLYAQYNAMDKLVAQLKSTGTSVQAQLDSIYYPGKASAAVP
jgi:flagellar hook-associated protein 2